MIQDAECRQVRLRLAAARETVDRELQEWREVGQDLEAIHLSCAAAESYDVECRLGCLLSGLVLQELRLRQLQERPEAQTVEHRARLAVLVEQQDRDMAIVRDELLNDIKAFASAGRQPDDSELVCIARDLARTVALLLLSRQLEVCAGDILPADDEAGEMFPKESETR
jgi:hypothetical protein